MSGDKSFVLMYFSHFPVFDFTVWWTFVIKRAYVEEGEEASIAYI